MLRYLAFAAVLLTAACTPPAGEQAQTSTAEQAEPAAPAAPSGPVSAAGTVTAVDAAAGTISINHEAIGVINWPAMEMQFTAEDPAILQGIAVGDRVAFDLRSAAEPQTIVSVRKQ
jgi:Cu(I)/Ag(I) efflux system periplasmic protein CusF